MSSILGFISVLLLWVLCGAMLGPVCPKAQQTAQAIHLHVKPRNEGRNDGADDPSLMIAHILQLERGAGAPLALES